MNKENVFLRIITYSPLVFIPLLIGMILLVSIKIYNDSFDNNLKKLEQNVYSLEKKSVEKKVIDVVNLISYKKSIIKEELTARVKNRVDTALLQAQNIYEQYKNTKSEKEIKQIIKTALRPLVWNEGESFIWIVDYKGVFNLAPNYLAHLEGSSIINLQDVNARYVIKEEIAICKSKTKGGFLWDTFTKPNDPAKKQYQQVAYVKPFGQYNWYFGSGEYLDTATKKTDKELLKSIAEIDSVDSNSHFIFLLNTNGDIFMNKSQPSIVGKNVSEIENTAIVNVIHKIINSLKSSDRASISYEWLNLHTNQIETKHSYITKIPNTDWIIDSGFYLTDIQEELLRKKVDMTELFSEKSSNIIYFAILLIGMALIISYYISMKLKRSFIEYEQHINDKSVELKELNENLENKVTERTQELENIKDELEVLATTDALTQMHNRYALMKFLSTEVNRSHRYDTPLSVIMYDVDHFKVVNDKYGHDIGDIVLSTLSKLVKKNIRDIDVVGRYGGEEFLVVLPNISIEEAKFFAHRLREEVEAYSFETVGSITISLGLVEVKNEENINELFQRVDKLLYKSKNNGRNQVTF